MTRMEPVESELLTRALRELVRRTRFPVAFGGFLDGGGITVTARTGTRTRSLEGLRVLPNLGLGGRAMTELRPRMTRDYGLSRQITHDYDGYVLGEGLRTLIAVPVLVDGRARGMLYAGSWADTPTEGVAAAPALEVADQLATELRVRDEVERRLRALGASAPAPALAPDQQEELRETFVEVRRIAQDLSDETLRMRLAAVEQRLIALSRSAEKTPDDEGAETAQPAVRLAPREIDVLSCAALGQTNAEIAEGLGLREGTVKAYLSSAMSRLSAATRHAAVVRARRAGLLP